MQIRFLAECDLNPGSYNTVTCISFYAYPYQCNIDLEVEGNAHSQDTQSTDITEGNI